jgi:hypothetical protein
VRRKLNLIPLDDGAGFIFDIMRFIVLDEISDVVSRFETAAAAAEAYPITA